ncbi:MAG: Type 1 glutamine amidotransferase-like domain-containing protein [Lachnospiraceae bacterium]|jgi:dipeptidase E|nr:Type 1 glutamine amidotransferase-like domain-containing protein [Lachnospiraceae bacterium]
MSKILFLTSSPFTGRGLPFNTENEFVSRMQKAMHKYNKGLFITASPDDYDETDGFSFGIKYTAELSGMEFESYTVLDRRNQNDAAKLVKSSNFIILGGGHVPTQNRFFGEIRLKELLEDFDGVIFGISAGSMNSAEEVYAQPELEGESLDPNYVRFIPGLGLTKTKLLPHYQDTKDSCLDGKRLFEDITYPDSMGHTFIAIPDGSYLYSEDGKEELMGEHFVISDGGIV